jgi:hypothetical protein
MATSLGDSLLAMTMKQTATTKNIVIARRPAGRRGDLGPVHEQIDRP